MINSLLVATDGYLKSPTPISIATRGYIQLPGGIVIPEEPPPPPLMIGGPGRRKKRLDLPPRDEIRQDILREDQEMLDIIIESILKGIIH